MIPGRVTIVIPHYNQVQYLEQAIESAIAQTYEDIEIIIVDDGSTHDVGPLDRKYRDRHTWIRFLGKTNGGLSSARNYGIKHASGEWILPLDADDKIHRTYVEKAVRANTDIVSCWIQYFGQQNTLFKITDAQPTHSHFLKRNRINCCSLFRKSMWLDIGGYDENMRDGYEDWEFWIRATAAGYKVVVLQEALFYYRKHGKSMVDHAIKNKSKIVQYMSSKHKMQVV